MAQPPNRIEVENLILAYFPNCPFCKGNGVHLGTFGSKKNDMQKL